MATLIISISAGTLKMSWSVRASCITRPFKRPWMRNPRAPGGHGIGRHQPRAKRSGGIEILAHRPLRCAELKITHARIVEQGVARHVIEGLLLGDELADHHGQLSFWSEVM